MRELERRVKKGRHCAWCSRVPVLNIFSAIRPLQLLLFEAERAWAYSQELKQASFENEQDGSIRRHGLARAHRAVQWSQSLLDLISALGKDRFNVFSRAEASAYHALISGYEAFDKGRHQLSLELLSVARKLFDLIADASNDSRKEALANSFVDGTEAMLRFSAYNLELSEQSMDKLASQAATPEVCEQAVKGYAELQTELAAQAQSAQSSDKSARLDHVEWRGRQIAIRHPDLVDAVSHVLSAEADLRAALDVKDNDQGKQDVTHTQKRQRLTSAQRSAKRRGQAIAVTSKTPAIAPAKAATAGSKTEMDGYDSLLASLTEAEDVARRLVQDNAEALSKSHSGRYEAASTVLIEAHEYLLFKLLATRTERNASLVDEVQQKSGRRQVRLRDAVAQHTEALASKGTIGSIALTARQKGREPIRRKAKPTVHKVRPANKPRAKKKGRQGKRNGAAGQRAIKNKKSPRMRAANSRLRTRADLRSRRIAVRIVPGLAKLLDANEMSCAGISGLGLVENDSDLTTLIEAKSAWYKAELLRFLSRSFAFTNEEDKALVLLSRADLFVREAQSAMELVSEKSVQLEDSRIPPTMSIDTFARTTEQIAAARLEVQRQAYLRRVHPRKAPGISKRSARVAPGAAAATKNAQGKAAQAVRDMAAKYVDFDPVDLQQAVQLDESLEARFARELQVSAPELPAQRVSSVPPHMVDRAAVAPKAGEATEYVDAELASSPIAAANVVDEDEPGEEVFDDAEAGPAFDPTNALYEEEERAAAEANSSKKRGWLGGWLGTRK